MHTCKGPVASCVPVCPCRVFLRSGSKTTGSATSLGTRTGLPVRVQNVAKSAGPSGDGVSTLRGAQLVTARRLSSWASPEYEWHEATSDASDSRGGGGGRVATCDGSVDHLVGWCTQWSQCCPYGPVRARLVSISWDGSRPGVLPATLGSWYASAVGDPSKSLTLQVRWTWPPSPWRRHQCKPQRAWRPVPGALLPEGMKGLTTGWRFGGRLKWLGPAACFSATPTSGLGHGASVEAVSYGAAPAVWPPPQPPYAPGSSETVSVVPPSCSWTYSSSSTPTERIPAWGALSDWPNPNSIPRKEILCIGKSLLFSQLTQRPNWLRWESTKSLCSHNWSWDWASMSQSSR